MYAGHGLTFNVTVAKLEVIIETWVKDYMSNIGENCFFFPPPLPTCGIRTAIEKRQQSHTLIPQVVGKVKESSFNPIAQ